MKYRAAIFDLDGVIVDTARFHYIAWKHIAARYGKEFTQSQNERLKGVSRERSFEILMEECGLAFSEKEKEILLKAKNEEYVKMLDTLTQDDILPGVTEFLVALREKGIGIALGSASKNASYILQKLGIEKLFDKVIDGKQTSRAKPDPEVFLLGSKALEIPAEACMVFEDAPAGIQAAKAAGMGSIGIGNEEILHAADRVLLNLSNWETLMELFEP